MKYLSRCLIAFFSILISLSFMSCENLMFIDAAQLYVVSFETNGGSKIESYRTDIIEKIPDCKKEDADFLGWYTSSDFSSDKITFPYELKEDTTLYAKWVQKYQVLFETNGGSEITGYKTSEIKDSPITLKNGSIFAGWYTNPEFTGEAATFPYTLTEPTVFYAKWDQIFTVKFETNGGSTLADVRGTSISDAPVSTKPGYILKGWYSDSELKLPVTFPFIIPGDCTLYAKWEASSDITYTVEHYKQREGFTAYVLTETETLQGSTGALTKAKAKDYTGFHSLTFEQKQIVADGSTVIQIDYDIDSFTIVFNSNYGTNETYTQTYSYNQNQKLTTNTFTRSNYSFEGWATETDGAVKYKDSESVKFALKNNSSLNLYAVWSYGNTITDATVSSLKLGSIAHPYTIKMSGEINQNTLVKLATKIATANDKITLDLSRTTGLDTIACNSDSTSVFKNCARLVNIILPSSLTTIGAYAFYYCTNLTSVTIPLSVKTIGTSAFYNTGLKEINISGDGSLVIGQNTFSNCGSLSKVTMSGVDTIGNNAFYYCKSLTTITINAKTVGTYAFSNCSSLTAVTVASSVTRIKSYAFNSCNNLTSVTFQNKSNWYKTNSTTVLTLTNPANNATNLRYETYDWYRK